MLLNFKISPISLDTIRKTQNSPSSNKIHSAIARDEQNRTYALRKKEKKNPRERMLKRSWHMQPYVKLAPFFVRKHTISRELAFRSPSSFLYSFFFGAFMSIVNPFVLSSSIIKCEIHRSQYSAGTYLVDCEKQNHFSISLFLSLTRHPRDK